MIRELRLYISFFVCFVIFFYAGANADAYLPGEVHHLYKHQDIEVRMQEAWQVDM